jgi:hypothetical protein
MHVRRLMQRLGGCFATIAWLPLLQCGTDEPLADARACESGTAECLADQQLRVCVDGAWSVRSCSDECASRPNSGGSFGCNLLEGPDDCACWDRRPCEPEGRISCSSSRHLASCVNGVTQVELCECADATQIGLGCQDLDDQPTCACASEGDPCSTAAWDVCVGDSALAHCEAGVWTVTPCAEMCSDAPSLGCVFSTLAGEGACACQKS